MSSPLDAHARPPVRLREVFKGLQKATSDEIAQDETIIDCNLAGRHDQMVAVDYSLPKGEILGSAFAEFLNDGSSSKDSAHKLFLPNAFECRTTPGISTSRSAAWKTS
jgi:hypothetical protein